MEQRFCPYYTGKECHERCATSGMTEQDYIEFRGINEQIEADLLAEVGASTDPFAILGTPIGDSEYVEFEKKGWGDDNCKQ